ncbi:TetR/AcrR family transcriptional regulator [Gordonia soli]|uniref:Putative TetR family transcriptional regulator n=1 Tax=Gordonia soli NBRC 108243 TaxID=1223545 RepID=M0QEM7_9ACTN|nr:helix-turn-helix domain-containing protein [Gordonia soli]GAC66874.1 putative TetR family transcriptional regulator [Gordonia soli NBRC 108243]
MGPPRPPGPTWRGTQQTAAQHAAHRRILDAAAEILVNRRVDELTMSAVARRAGCSRATLYRYVPDRDALVTAVLEDKAVEALSGKFVAATRPRPAPGDPHGATVAAMVFYIRLARARRDHRLWPTLVTDHSIVSCGVRSTMFRSIAASFSGFDTDADEVTWLLRLMFSVLGSPERDAETERRMLVALTAGLFR